MAILTRLLVLAACVPLLLPPGLCVCTAGESVATTSPVRPGVDAGLVDDRPAPHGSGGCSHRHAPGRPADPVPDEQPTAPAPCDDHAPGCPAASAGVERVQRCQPASDLTAGLSVAPVLHVSSAPQSSACRPAFSPAPRHPSTPPLYLSHCSLVV